VWNYRRGIRCGVDSDWYSDLCPLRAANRDSDAQERILFDGSDPRSQNTEGEGFFGLRGVVDTEGGSTSIKNVTDPVMKKEEASVFLAFFYSFFRPP